MKFFKGLIVPVFTVFNDDKKRTIDFDVIEKYALYLKQKGMHAVLVNSIVGEGSTLRIDERKRLAEEWVRAARKHSLKVIVNIGGASVPETYEMAEHSEKLGVDGILVLPDTIYRPITEEDLVYYLRDVARYAPSTPLLYYHVPLLTGVHLRLWRVYDLIEKEINNFGGIYFADYNVEHALETLKYNDRTDRTVILAFGKTLINALTSGFETVSSVAFNLYPEQHYELYDHILNNRLKEGIVVQDRIFKQLRSFWTIDEDVIFKLKTEFNKLNLGFKVGVARKPVYNHSMFLRF